MLEELVSITEDKVYFNIIEYIKRVRKSSELVQIADLYSFTKPNEDYVLVGTFTHSYDAINAFEIVQNDYLQDATFVEHRLLLNKLREMNKSALARWFDKFKRNNT